MKSRDCIYQLVSIKFDNYAVLLSVHSTFTHEELIISGTMYF